jgi:hypothetical protein
VRWLPLLLLAGCPPLPHIQVVGWDRGSDPQDWAPTIAYYGEGWGDFRPHMLCALRTADDPGYGAGLVVEFRHGAGCEYDPLTETITADDFDCAVNMLEVRGVDVGFLLELDVCKEVI